MNVSCYLLQNATLKQNVFLVLRKENWKFIFFSCWLAHEYVPNKINAHLSAQETAVGVHLVNSILQGIYPWSHICTNNQMHPSIHQMWHVSLFL